MSNYVGDFPTGSVVRFMFATNLGTGARADPSSAWEAADVRVYKDGSTTERSSTAGFTVTSTYDSMTGVTFVAIDTSDNTDSGFYAAGSDYHVVLYPDETVDSVAVSAPIAHFSIDNRKLLRPATAARQLVVDASGLADANMVKMGPTGSGTAQTARDIGTSVLLSNGTGTGQLKLASGYVAMTWADIGAPTTTVNLSGTTVKTLTDKVAGITGTIDTFDDFVSATGKVTLAATQTFDNTGTWTGNITGNLSGSVGSVSGAVGSVTGAVGSVTGNVGGNVTGSVGSVAAGGIAAASFAAGAIDASAIAADAIGSSELAATAANEIADAILDRATAIEGYTPRQAFRLILASLAAKLSGAATTTVAIRDIADTKDRITATVDANGNRTAITLDAT